MGDEALAVWWSAVFPAAYQVFFKDGFQIGMGNWMSWWDKNPLHYLNKCVNLKYFQRIMRLIDAKPREVQAHLLPWMPYPAKLWMRDTLKLTIQEPYFLFLLLSQLLF